MGIVYRLYFSTTNKSYIGLTTGSLEKRFRRHANAIKNITSKNYQLVHRAWNKYGAPELSIICEVSTLELFKAEQNAIKFFNTLRPNGYNLTKGGEGTIGHKHSKAAKQKMSKTAKGVKRGPQSKQHKQRIAKALKGNHNCSGYVHSKEARRKISKALKYREITWGQKISETKKLNHVLRKAKLL